MSLKNNKNFHILSRTTNFDETGVVTGSIIAQCGSTKAVRTALDTKTHPRHSFLKRESGQVQFLEAGMARITLNFAGIDPDSDGQVTTTIKAALSNEPIQTHPTFTRWSTRFNPIFNDDGTFKGFPATLENGGDNNKIGIESYLDPTITYEQSKVFAKAAISKLAKEVRNIGHIDDSFYTGTGIPPAPTPDGDGGWERSWLLVSGAFEEVGEGGIVKKVWKLSGRRGWDQLIYGR